mgnify:CR=1 FL=1
MLNSHGDRVTRTMLTHYFRRLLANRGALRKEQILFVDLQYHKN